MPEHHHSDDAGPGSGNAAGLLRVVEIVTPVILNGRLLVPGDEASVTDEQAASLIHHGVAQSSRRRATNDNRTNSTDAWQPSLTSGGGQRPPRQRSSR